MEKMKSRFRGKPTFGQGVRLDRSGRAIVPAAIRKALGITSGEMFLISLVEDGIRLQTVEAGLGRIWAIADGNGQSVENEADDFIADRRTEAAKG